MEDEFKVTWEAEDGYCGGSRPQHFTISTDNFEADTSEKGLRELFQEMLQSDFEQTAYPTSDDEDRFVAWARERQQEMGEE